MRISGAESLIMEALWKRAPLTSEQIFDEVGPGQAWTGGTLKSLLNRLLTKGAVGAVREGRRYLYRPLVERSDYVHAESANLIDRLFDGRLAPLVSHFSQRSPLTDEDIEELKRVVGELENGR